MTNDTNRERFAFLMHEAQERLHQHDYLAAERILERAHLAGHAVKADHLLAHRALIRLGWVQRKPVQVLSQAALLALAFLFDRRVSPRN